MKVVKYYQISAAQLFLMALLIGVIAAALIVINNTVREYLLLPEVVMSGDQCVTVVSYKNGDAYACGDVDVILRKYRIKSP